MGYYRLSAFNGGDILPYSYVEAERSEHAEVSPIGYGKIIHKGRRYRGENQR